MRMQIAVADAAAVKDQRMIEQRPSPSGVVLSRSTRWAKSLTCCSLIFVTLAILSMPFW